MTLSVNAQRTPPAKGLKGVKLQGKIIELLIGG